MILVKERRVSAYGLASHGTVLWFPIQREFTRRGIFVHVLQGSSKKKEVALKALLRYVNAAINAGARIVNLTEFYKILPTISEFYSVIGGSMVNPYAGMEALTERMEDEVIAISKAMAAKDEAKRRSKPCRSKEKSKSPEYFDARADELESVKKRFSTLELD